MKMYLSDIYTVAVNLAGLPGLTVPCSMNEKGLPIGVQLLGDCFREKTLFAAASAIENVRGEMDTSSLPERRPYHETV